jgi:hypothetical protein
MNFNIREWSRIYNKVQALGNILKDSLPTYDEYMKEMPPANELSNEMKDNIELEIKILLERSNRYLDQCGMRFPKALWKYDRKDPKTWLSHESFKYRHLMEF